MYCHMPIFYVLKILNNMDLLDLELLFDNNHECTNIVTSRLLFLK
jgi:hypothetical protein